MAKKKNNTLNLVCKILVLVFSILTIVSFFLPAFNIKDTDSNYSNANICFTSVEKAEDKLSEAIKDGDEDSFSKYTAIIAVKDENAEGRGLVMATAWIHFVAMVASVIGLVLFLLSKLFNVVKVANLSLALSALLIIISLILGICFLNTEYEVLGGLSSSAYGKIYAMSFWGLILGTISSIVSWALNLIVLNNNKSKKKK